MKIVKNDIFPFEGFLAMTIWPIVFVRNGYNFDKIDERHEMIHGEQQKEMIPIGIALAVILFLLGCGWWSLLALPVYLILYVGEWLVRVMLLGFKGEWYHSHKAYRAISFEQEAYFFETDSGYLSRRPHFVWVRYLFKDYNK